MKHALVLDTMVYLHYRPVDQIDWHAEFGLPRTDEVLIVVPGITLREIDNHKNHTPRLRDRARRVSEQLEQWMSVADAEVRPGVRLKSDLAPPNIDIRDMAFDPTNNDDVLVASAFAFQRSHADVQVILVTDDSYPRARARDLGIAVGVLQDRLKLPLEEDPLAKENRELRQENQRLLAARPKIDLRFAGDEGKSTQFTLPTVIRLSDLELEEEMERIAQEVPPASAYRKKLEDGEKVVLRIPGFPTQMLEMLVQAQESREALEASILGPIGAGELSRYEKDRAAFLDRYRSYLVELRDYEIATSRSFGLDIELFNSGSAPASDIDVFLHVPDGVMVEEDDVLEAPAEPEPPEPPARTREIEHRSIMDLARSSIGTPLDIMAARHLAFDRAERLSAAVRSNVSSLRIERTNSYEIRCHVTQAKHGIPVRIPRIHMRVPDDAPVRPFQVTYSLYAANVPDPVSGELNVVLEAAEPRP